MNRISLPAADLAEIGRQLEAGTLGKKKGGSAETLREYWTGEGHPGPSHGAYEKEIAWGTPGDFMRCVALLKEHAGMSDKHAKGYCNLRHHEALGYWPAQHARMERGKAAEAELLKAGPEGYIHGFICVRPPCGEKPGKISHADLAVQKDGGIVHRKSGYSVGHVGRNDDGSWSATHADGTKGKAHGSRTEALKEVARRYNSGKTQAGLGGDTAEVKKPPVRSSPAKPAVKPQTAAVPRSGADEWKNGTAGTADYTPAEIAAVARAWYNKDFYYTNQLMRTGKIFGISDDKVNQLKKDAGIFRMVIEKSKPFDHEVTTYRGMTSGNAIFGPPGSKIGKVVTDEGFGSTTTNLDFAKSWGATRAIIRFPPGTRALKADPRVYSAAKKVKGQTPLDQLQEYTLPPGTRFQVTNDKVISSGGRDYRLVYLDVLP